MSESENVDEEYEEVRGVVTDSRDIQTLAAYNVGVVADYIGFNTSYVLSKKIRAYARTKYTGLNPLSPYPQWSIAVRGDLYKNGKLHSSAPSTRGVRGNSDVRTNTPYDYTVKPGNNYKFNSYYYVYDYYGKRIWSKSHYRTKTY